MLAGYLICFLLVCRQNHEQKTPRQKSQDAGVMEFLEEQGTDATLVMKIARGNVCLMNIFRKEIISWP